tara:strand:- start:418 stop:918 length:501 start_codon:yes stop_codon:yes gene_type:complete
MAQKEAKKKRSTKTGGKIKKTEWEALQEEMSSADDGTIQVVDLTDPSKQDTGEIDSNYSFSVFYKTPKEHKHYKGALLYGTFTGHIATYEDHMKMGHVRAQCRAGLPPDSFDEEFNLMVEQKAVFTVLLDSKPEWFDLENLFDRMVAIEVYQEVIQREATFRGGVL